jgi:hypothetical protein
VVGLGRADTLDKVGLKGVRPFAREYVAHREEYKQLHVHPSCNTAGPKLKEKMLAAR